MNTQRAQSYWEQHVVTPQWFKGYHDSRSKPYRRWVLDALGQFAWTSVFEIGCHCGPMLSVIREAYPEALFGGCDVNPSAAALARTMFPGVMTGPFPGVTAAWPDQSVDVVLSCYALAYIDPDDIEAALIEAGRLARVGIVICEPIAWDVALAGVARNGKCYVEWRYPYLNILMGLPSFVGWTAHCQERDGQDTRLSGFIRVMRP